MKQLRSEPHPNVIQLQHQFYSSGERSDDEVYLNLVLEYMPDTVYGVARAWQKAKTLLPTTHARSVWAALPSAGPDPRGRHLPPRHQAPELVIRPENARREAHRFWGARKFWCRASRTCPTSALILSGAGADLWFDRIHDGHRRLVVRVRFCGIIAGRTAVSGDSGVDQLVEIIKVLGHPSRDDIREMNVVHGVQVPQIRAHAWAKVFRSRTPAKAVRLRRDLPWPTLLSTGEAVKCAGARLLRRTQSRGRALRRERRRARAAAALRLHAARTRGVPGPRGPAASTGSRRGSAILTLHRSTQGPRPAVS